MTRQDFEDRLSDLVTDAFLTGLARDQIITALEHMRQSLVDEQLSDTSAGGSWPSR